MVSNNKTAQSIPLFFKSSIIVIDNPQLPLEKPPWYYLLAQHFRNWYDCPASCSVKIRKYKKTEVVYYCCQIVKTSNLCDLGNWPSLWNCYQKEFVLKTWKHSPTLIAISPTVPSLTCFWGQTPSTTIYQMTNHFQLDRFMLLLSSGPCKRISYWIFWSLQ